MSEWQPIETAPKDGQRRLFFSPGNPKANIERARRAAMRVDYYPTLASKRCWEEYPEAPYTYWMPLPAPPAAP